MTAYFISADDFKTFLTRLIGAKRVIGPVAKKKSFAFDTLGQAEDLRLDYDVTILPPKKAFFPTAQDLVRFQGTEARGCIEPVEQVLLGVHPYDVRGIDITDFLFREKHSDRNYLANREATTIVAANPQRAADGAFWGNKGPAPEGHDAFLTKIETGYVYEARTPKGAALLEYGGFRKAEPTHTADAEKARAKTECKDQPSHKLPDVIKKLWDAYGDKKVWNELAEDCFSCGSCNVVCPTCYCFDVQDAWNLDQRSGARTRYWDACLTEGFAKVSLGTGASENFRESRGERFRHRIMRKMAYLNKKVGSPACVGCGRCVQACTAEIASPLKAVNRIMER